MTVNTEVKGTLAKLLATEDLTVEHRQVSTASFDVNNRVLTLPIWTDASNTVYDLLVGHEVGHALYTPNIPIDAPKGFVNVIEDARIERMMKHTYPGLRKSFFDGYRELWHKDFFGVADEEISNLSFIDRINLFFKGNSSIEFNPDEQVWVDRVASTKTFDDVLQLSKELYEWAESQEEKKEAEQPQQLDIDWNNPSAGNEIEEEYQPEEGQGEGESDRSTEQKTKTQEEIMDDLEDAMYDDTIGGESGCDETESVTDKALQQSLETLISDDTREYVYLNLPKIDIDKVIIDCNTIQNELNLGFYGRACRDKDDHDYYFENIEYAESHFKAYKKEAQKSVNYLVKQFEMKKSADEYKRSATSKTGVIDTQSLYKYRLSDDIFRRVTVIPEGKNHGLVFYLDWSGSMNHILLDTLKQTFNLVWFCRKAGIPFRVYGFQNGWESGHIHPALKAETNVLGFCSGFKLLEFFSSRQNKQSLEKSMKLVYMQAFAMAGHRLPYVEKYTLGGTPLGEAVLCSQLIVDRMRSIEKVQKINVVCLTDGESNPMHFHSDAEMYGENGVYSRQLRMGTKYVLRDSVTGYTREFKPSPYLTTKEIVSFFKEITNFNWVGIRICTKKEMQRSTRILSYDDAASMDTQWSKEKFASSTLLGYTEAFFIPYQGMGEGTQDLEVKQKGVEATRAELTRAFKKHMGSKMTNKTILNKFVEQIA
tara:strand:- start:231 stop:2351 length:2121 start_codon:yes stop_codon:yes gene_type:complete